MKKVKVLETTLRDGSYAINFQFTSADTAIICSELEKAGFDLIEIGHGVGLHASETGFGQAAETDEEYCKAAAEALTTAQYGMFAIPGIARLEDIDMAAEHGMGFIRIGTNVTDVAQSEEYIARAKKHGMFVSANFMKSYATEPREFAQCAVMSQKYGSDVLSVVDSAGGMLQGELEAYMQATRDACDIPLAFHGHDNLGLAVSHSVRAAELRATIVDGSLQGMGRSSGNAATEILLCALDRTGFDTGIDILQTMDIGAKYIKPMMRRQGISGLDIVTGYAQFHSSFMGSIRKISSKYRIDPRKLIIGVCKEDKVNAPVELVERVAKEISETTSEVYSARFNLADYFGAGQD